MKNKGFDDLHKIYSQLEGLESDFRNTNLNALIVSKLGNKTHLDIGSGAGHLLHASKNAGYSVHGVEPNKDLITLSRKLYGDAVPIDSLYGEELHKLKKKFDNITMVDVLEHIEDDGTVLKSVKEILADNGKLIVIVPAFQFLYSERDKSIGHYRRYSKSQLKNLLERNGFEIQEMRYWNMLMVLPYYVLATLMKKKLKAGARSKDSNKLLNRFLFQWFRHVENRVDFGVGLSLIAVVKKKG